MDQSTPISVKERIVSLDVLRGVAILGILLMNVVTFGMVLGAYEDPSVYNDTEGVDWYVWLVLHVFADNKFMSIFSILFGAGICIFMERATAKANDAWGLQISRMGWLLVIALLHAYLIWFGDILFTYSLCGVCIAFFRKCRPGTLVILGVVLGVIVPITINKLFHWSVQFWPPESIEEMTAGSELLSQANQEETDAYLGSYWDQLQHRAVISIFMQIFLFPFYLFWRGAGLMFIGMALYKWGVLSGRQSKKFYAWMLTIGLALGMPLILIGVHFKVQSGFDPILGRFSHSNWNIVGAVFMAMAWIALVLLFCKTGVWQGLQRCLAAVGRMALTNYIMQSILGTWFFYGVGLGFYGSLERWQMLFVVAGIWAFQIIFSIFWLKRFRFGPLEWLWRCGTYMQIQKNRL